jgi:hypothetical protein
MIVVRMSTLPYVTGLFASRPHSRTNLVSIVVGLHDIDDPGWSFPWIRANDTWAFPDRAWDDFVTLERGVGGGTCRAPAHSGTDVLRTAQVIY